LALEMLFVTRGVLMRALLSLAALIVGLALHGAYAQSVAQRESSNEPAKDLRAQADSWFKDCKQGWDAATHMTRRDYERTCLRMAQERVKFMRDWEKTSSDRAKSK
jgi:invasion protein IalB